MNLIQGLVELDTVWSRLRESFQLFYRRVQKVIYIFIYIYIIVNY